MAWVDYVLLGIVLISVLLGALRGFIREALSLATWIAAFVGALYYGAECAARLRSTIVSEPIRVVLGYTLPFFLILLVGGLLTWAIARAVRGAGLAPVDRMLGSGFGLLRGGLIVVALVMIAGVSALGREPWWRQSAIAPQLQPLAAGLVSLIPGKWYAYMRAQQPPGQAPLPQREK